MLFFFSFSGVAHFSCNSIYYLPADALVVWYDRKRVVVGSITEDEKNVESEFTSTTAIASTAENNVLQNTDERDTSLYSRGGTTTTTSPSTSESKMDRNINGTIQ